MAEIMESPARHIMRGVKVSAGIAFGILTFLKRDAKPADRRDISDIDAELERFEQARAKAMQQLGTLYEASVEKLGEQNAVLFQIHQMMLDDPDYVNEIRQTIKEKKVNAEYAVDKVARKFADMFASMDNDYMQGRAGDVIDVSRRVGDILSLGAGAVQGPRLQSYGDSPLILAADDLAPSEAVQLDKYKVTGIVTSEGSSRSHTVIFARTMGIPSVICVGSSLMNESLEGHFVILDGSSGILIVDPSEDEIASYRERKKTEDVLSFKLEQYRGKETLTAGGRKIRLYANIGNVDDLDVVLSSDAEGIGLFRSEYIYLSTSDFPTEQEQFAVYKQVLEGMQGRTVIIRTLDIGADKTADYFTLKPEENPAMGMRAVRICLTRPEIFKTQLRALLRASVYGSLAIMFPMITSVEELQGCLAILDETKQELAAAGESYSQNLEVGIMIETPAAALISEELAPLVDFFSIGTNDLTQFTLAVDRQNAEVGRFLNPYHHAVIKLIDMTVKNAHNAGIWAGICGELAADEAFTAELVGMGIDEISVAPSSVLQMRAKIASLS